MAQVTGLDRKIIQIASREKPEKGIVICALLAIREYELEKDVQEYLDRNPNTSFSDLDDYIISLCPPLEIVDDEELDEEE